MYGYCDNTKLESLKYLAQIGKIDKNVYFGYGFCPEIELAHEEFVKFITLYAEDFKKFWGENEEFNFFEEIPNIKHCLDYKDSVIISWS